MNVLHCMGACICPFYLGCEYDRNNDQEDEGKPDRVEEHADWIR